MAKKGGKKEKRTRENRSVCIVFVVFCILVVLGEDLECIFQEPLNAPFLNGLFSRGFSKGKTAH